MVNGVSGSVHGLQRGSLRLEHLAVLDPGKVKILYPWTFLGGGGGCGRQTAQNPPTQREPPVNTLAVKYICLHATRHYYDTVSVDTPRLLLAYT